MYCHENASIANNASWMYDGDVYCQCNGYRFGCDRNKGCEVRPYIFSTLSEIPIKMTLNAETSYNFAFAGGMIRKDGLSIWQAFVFEGLEGLEELLYGNCYADLDELKANFKKSKNKKLTKEIEPEAFEATCSAEKVEEIQQYYLKTSDEYIYFILDSYRIEVHQGGQRKLLVTVPPSDRIISMRNDDSFIYYRTKNHKQEQRKRFDELVTSTEKPNQPRSPCNEISCDVVQKFKEIEEGYSSLTKEIFEHVELFETTVVPNSISKSNSKILLTVFGLVLLTRRLAMILSNE
uniref:Uncharacterized protein n=1 Tax=Acrobeloides nanus TaxID=290746 RepID=A0A914CHF8_9BILA